MKKFLIQFAVFLFASISIGHAQTSNPVTKDDANAYQVLSMLAFLPDETVLDINNKSTRLFDEKFNRAETMIEQAQKGNRVHQAILGIAYYSGSIKQLPISYDQAEYWFRKSADQGFEPSFYHLAELIYCRKPKTQKNVALVIEYLNKANNFPLAILTQADSQIDKKNITTSEIVQIRNKLLKLKLDSKGGEYLWGLFAEIQSPDVDITLARIYNKLGDNESAEKLLISALDIKTLTFPIEVSSSSSSTIERYQYLVRALRAVQSKKQIPNPRQSFYCD